MKVQTIPPITFLYQRNKSTIHGLKDLIPVGQDLFREASSRNMWITGPIHWHYYNFTGNPDDVFDVEVALPVGSVPEGYDGRFHIKRTDPFRGVVASHKGAWNSIPETYAQIFAFLSGEGLKHNNVCREIYINVDLENENGNYTEIQVGVE